MRKKFQSLGIIALAAVIIFTIPGCKSGGTSDSRVELTAGNAVGVAASATSASVTFSGASGLTLAAADFTVSGSASISDVSVTNNTVTVTVTFAANTSTASTKQYTVGIAAGSTKIKGSATVTITQAAALPGECDCDPCTCGEDCDCDDCDDDPSTGEITLTTPEDKGVTLNVQSSVQDLIIYKDGDPSSIEFELKNPPAAPLTWSWYIDGFNEGSENPLTINADDYAAGEHLVFIVLKESEYISWSSTSFKFEIIEEE